MSEANYQSVPWISSAEWVFVRDALFSGVPRRQRRAIDRIDAWRCRAQRSLPVSIISTVDLMRLALLDGVVHLEPSVPPEVDDTHLRLAYSMALVRFVNLSTEILQKRTAQAVHMLAGDMGLPEWLVNIRHEATHYTLPSMDLLRNGVSVALEWLKLTYWDEQSKNIRLSEGLRAFAVDDLSVSSSSSSPPPPAPFGRDETAPLNGDVNGEEERRNEEERKIEERLSGLVVDARIIDAAPLQRADSAVDWSRVPIGVLPGQSLTVSSLDLPDCVDALHFGVESVDLPTLTYHWHEEEVA